MKSLCLSHFPLHLAVMVSHGNLAVSIIQGMVYAQEQAKVTNVLTITALSPFSFQLKRRVQSSTAVPIVLGYLPMFHSYGLHQYCLRSVRQKPYSSSSKDSSCLPDLQSTCTGGDSCHLATVEPKICPRSHTQVHFFITEYP